MRIAVDAMGGDHAPRAAITGAYRAAVEDGTPISWSGSEGVVRAELDRLGDPGDLIEMVHAEDVVEHGRTADPAVRQETPLVVAGLRRAGPGRIARRRWSPPATPAPR